MNLRLLPEKKPIVATVTISDSITPDLVVLDVAYGHARLSIVADAIEVRDLRRAEKNTGESDRSGESRSHGLGVDPGLKPVESKPAAQSDPPPTPNAGGAWTETDRQRARSIVERLHGIDMGRVHAIGVEGVAAVHDRLCGALTESAPEWVAPIVLPKPRATVDVGFIGWNKALDACAAALRSAGLRVEGDGR